MNQRPKIEGAAAALFDEMPQITDDEVLALSAAPLPMSPEMLAAEIGILKARLNEIFDYIFASSVLGETHHFSINLVHRFPADIGLGVQDTSRIPDTGKLR